MIALLTGRLAFKAPTHLALDVQGVGYEVFIPLSTYYNLPNLNDSISLSIHTHVREDAIQLFGFITQQEKEAFVLLMTVSGIGPKSALGILSALPVSDLVSAIQSADVEKLETVPGIGKKSAGRLVLELKDKLLKLHPESAYSRPCHHRTRRNLRRRSFRADQFGVSWIRCKGSAETGSEITVRVVESSRTYS